MNRCFLWNLNGTLKFQPHIETFYLNVLFKIEKEFVMFELVSIFWNAPSISNEGFHKIGVDIRCNNIQQ